MATKIKIKNSTVAGKAPKPADLDRAELAINLADKKIYTKDASDAIIELGGGGGAELVHIGPIAPASPVKGNLWKSDTKGMTVYDGSNWISVESFGVYDKKLTPTDGNDHDFAYIKGASVNAVIKSTFPHSFGRFSCGSTDTTDTNFYIVDFTSYTRFGTPKWEIQRIASQANLSALKKGDKIWTKLIHTDGTSITTKWEVFVNASPIIQITFDSDDSANAVYGSPVYIPYQSSNLQTGDTIEIYLSDPIGPSSPGTMWYKDATSGWIQITDFDSAGGSGSGTFASEDEVIARSNNSKAIAPEGLNGLFPKEMLKKTVGVGKDFTNLYDAMIWATKKFTRSNTQITLVLDPGIHTIGTTEYQIDQSIEHSESPERMSLLPPIDGLSLVIAGGKDPNGDPTKTTIKVDVAAKPEAGSIFHITGGTSSLSIKLLTIDGQGWSTSNPSLPDDLSRTTCAVSVANRAECYLSDCIIKYFPIGIRAKYSSYIKSRANVAGIGSITLPSYIQHCNKVGVYAVDNSTIKLVRDGGPLVIDNCNIGVSADRNSFIDMVGIANKSDAATTLNCTKDYVTDGEDGVRDKHGKYGSYISTLRSFDSAPARPTVIMDTAAPASPNKGDFWYDTTPSKAKPFSIYNGSAWIAI